jgi:hypothetical protein
MSVHSRWRRHRHAISSIAVAALLIGSFGLTAIFATTQVASATPTGDFVLPVGASATISNAAFSACDSLVYGYELNLNPSTQVPLGNMDGCPDAGTRPGTTTIGPVITQTTVTIFLTDYTLDDTFLSDGNHALVSGSNPYTVDIMDDAVGDCSTTCPRPPTAPGQGNVTLTLTVIPPPLTGSPVTVGPATTNAALNTSVATFVDADSTAPISNYSATINWGDGTSSAATSITLAGSTYTVNGTHTYTAHGTTTSPVTVDISSADGGSAVVTDNDVTVADAVIACTTSPCSGTVTSSTLSAQASTSSTGKGDLLLDTNPNSGSTALNCGDDFRHAPRIIIESNTFAVGSGSITTTDTFLNKNGIPGKGLEGLLYAICFQSQNPFVDAFGKSTTLGLLPICNPFKPGPGPCENWILPGSGGTIVEKVTYPAGDPKYG